MVGINGFHNKINLYQFSLGYSVVSDSYVIHIFPQQ